MSEYNADEIRERIAECRADVARADGEKAALVEQIEVEKNTMRELLDCAPGEERDSVRELRDEIEHDQGRLEKLIVEAERIRDSGDDEEEEDG